MRTLIVGAGKIGLNLIGYLSSTLEERTVYDLTVIEVKKEHCKEVSDRFDATIFLGDGSESEILEAAEASKADLLVASTDSDQVNMTIVRRGKQDFHIPRVVAVANSPENRGLLTKAGADRVVCPIALAIKDFEGILSR